MKIVRSVIGLLVVGSLFFIASCNKSSTVAILGDWQKKAAFAGVPRSGAVSFAIGDKAYVGLGYDGQLYQNDFYVWDEAKSYWDTIAPFPGLGRELAVAFSANGKGYVGTGYNRDSVVQLNDFWEYDPATYKWSQVSNFGGGGRSGAVAFSDGANGYVGTGFNKSYFADFWQYNTNNDTWTKIPSYSGDKRQLAATMTISGKTYLFGGTNNGSYIYDIWEFDPTVLAAGNNPWTDQTPLTTDAQYNNFKAAVARSSAVAFTLDNKGYITTGASNGQVMVTTFQFDPVAKTYTQMTSFEKAARTQAVAFVVHNDITGSNVYVTTGLQGTTRFDDMMTFKPGEQYVFNN